VGNLSGLGRIRGDRVEHSLAMDAKRVSGVDHRHRACVLIDGYSEQAA